MNAEHWSSVMSLGVAGATVLAVQAALQIWILRAWRRSRPAPKLRLIGFDACGPIVGKPTRAQWRLRRRTLMEAVEICESGGQRGGDTDHSATFAAHRHALKLGALECSTLIRQLVREYDEQSPEFSGVEPSTAERVA